MLEINKGLKELIIEETKSSFSKFWMFTVFNYNEKEGDKTKLNNLYGLGKEIRYIVFQSEICPVTKNKHLQGYVELNARIRRLGLQKTLGCGKIWCEPRKAGDNKSAIAYCTKPNEIYKKEIASNDTYDEEADIRYEKGKKEIKQGTRTDWEDIMYIIKSGNSTLDEIKNKYPKIYLQYRNAITAEFKECNIKLGKEIKIELYDWQKDHSSYIIDEKGKIKGPMDRCLFWIWSIESETGKTRYINYLQSKAYTLAVTTFKWNDIMMLWKEKHKIVWINLSREATESQNDYLIQILESMTDGGMKASGKYEGEEKELSSHIIVTSNDPPPNNRLPKRIIEYNIGPNGQLKNKIDHRKEKQECEKEEKKKKNKYEF